MKLLTLGDVSKTFIIRETGVAEYLFDKNVDK